MNLGTHRSPLSAPSRALSERIRETIDGKTKPVGALGRLEWLAGRICIVQGTLTPEIVAPHIVVFAGDHGIARHGVSAFPQAVTWQMVTNFLNGGAAINVFARINRISLEVVDAGVNHDFGDTPALVDEKIGYGTRSFLEAPAMTSAECETAIGRGADRVTALGAGGCNVIGFGEMGIGNSAAAAIIMSLLCKLPLSSCVGAGAGLDEEGVARKRQILAQAIRNRRCGEDPLEIMATFGGYELAMMCGAYLSAARAGMLVLVDGFIATAALLVAAALEPALLEYCVFSHRSSERGHREMLRHLGAEPLLNLDMRLGEGTGAALAFPLVVAATGFVNEMASFESAGVSGRSE